MKDKELFACHDYFDNKIIHHHLSTQFCCLTPISYSNLHCRNFSSCWLFQWLTLTVLVFPLWVLVIRYTKRISCNSKLSLFCKLSHWPKPLQVTSTFLRLCHWWRLRTSTLYLLASQVTITPGNSGLCFCVPCSTNYVSLMLSVPFIKDRETFPITCAELFTATVTKVIHRHVTTS